MGNKKGPLPYDGGNDKQTTNIDYFEEEYPNLSKEFKNIQQEQYALFATKMLSYGIDNIAMGTTLEKEEDKKLSLTSIWIRCSDKMARLKQLVILGKNNPLENEPATDAWKDIVNYNIIAQIVYKGKWKK